MILIDLKVQKMSVFEFFGKMDQYKADPQWADYEFYLDGSDKTVKAELRRNQNGKGRKELC